MKIGIVTFHRADNLGAVLQASALCRYLNQGNDTVEIIDFIPNNNVPSYPLPIYRIRCFFSVLFHKAKKPWKKTKKK